MTDQPEKLDLRSQDIAEDKRQEILRLLPEIRTEGGKIDFERLRLALGEAVDVGRERYGMNWPGKAECFKTIQAPSLGTLRPCPTESVNFDTTENVIIEGDNLEVLKLLQKSYLGKVKMIYIDPPYNTGNDFIYPDDYAESLQTYLEYTGQVDSEGTKFGTNTEASGRYHSQWVNMMFPRLYLARNLLRDDGAIFVSIDDTEVHQLRHVMNDVFGEENFVECFVWKRSYGGGAKEKYAVSQHEYILMYSRSLDCLGELWLPPNEEVERKYYKYQDTKVSTRGPYRLQPLEAGKTVEHRPNLIYPVTLPDGRVINPKRQWLWSQERMQRAVLADEIVVSEKNGETTLSYKQYLKDEAGNTRGAKPPSVIDGIYTQHGTQELASLFPEKQYFQFPKPTRLLKLLLQFGMNEDGVVLDFFAGSCTTAHAVLDLNREDGGKRQFILVQLPEQMETPEFRHIAAFGEERVRRVIRVLNEKDSGKLDMDGGTKPDRGFRVFKLDQSNFTTWDAGIQHESKALERQLELHIEHVRDGRTDNDILYEMLLKSGYPLTAPVEKQTLAGKTVYNVAGGLFMICLERELTLNLIRAIAERKPERVVLLDEGFAGNDQLKANAVQIFKTKGVTSFKTV